MKRSIVLSILCLAGAAGCSPAADAPARADEVAASAWQRPPEVSAVARQGATLLVSGAAGPRARVVLRGVEGEAVASSAAADGRFEIRLPAPAGDALLTLEVQSGEEAFTAPARLLVLRGGPVALLSEGQAAIRLDRAGPLDAVDSDGAAMVLSGRASAAPSVAMNGVGLPVVFEKGRWRAEAPAGAGAIRVGSAAYDYPGPSGGAGFSTMRAGKGWSVAWSPQGGGGRQSTWLPDRS